MGGRYASKPVEDGAAGVGVAGRAARRRAHGGFFRDGEPIRF
jgi:hypothetical protein